MLLLTNGPIATMDPARPMAEALAEIQRRTLEPLFDGFTAAEQQALQEYLCRMDANIQRQLKKE